MRVSIGVAILLLANIAYAGTIYEVTATNGNEKVTYQVKFGGGKAVSQRTAFDPKTKKFVYLTWKRSEPAPEPAATIWDHKTGETIKLFKFPNAENPLPIIPSIKDMKVCPLTDDKTFTFKRVGNYD
jgi:hypothetical protein